MKSTVWEFCDDSDEADINVLCKSTKQNTDDAAIQTQMATLLRSAIYEGAQTKLTNKNTISTTNIICNTITFPTPT